MVHPNLSINLLLQLQPSYLTALHSPLPVKTVSPQFPSSCICSFVYRCLLWLFYGHGTTSELCVWRPKIRICRKLESYARRFFEVAPIIIYALTYFLTPVAVSCFADTSSPVFPIAVSGMRVYGLGFLFSGINIFAAIRMMAYGKGISPV